MANKETKLVEAATEGKTLNITLVKSPISAIPKQRKTVEALGLRKLHKTVTLPDNAAVRGMIWHVRHLVEVTEN